MSDLLTIYLVGMPACGKTTLGLKLSELLHLNFVDIDAEIEKKSSMVITDIFESKGEDYFRLLESESLKEIIPQSNTIISTGGGAPCFFDNMEFMNKHGITVFIDTPLDILYQRASKSSQRPLLNGKTGTALFNEIKKKYDHRLPFYQKAKIHLKCSEISAENLNKKIDSYLKTRTS